MSDALDLYSYNESRKAWGRAAQDFWDNPSWSTGIVAGAKFVENMYDSAALLTPGLPAGAGLLAKAVGRRDAHVILGESMSRVNTAQRRLGGDTFDGGFTTVEDTWRRNAKWLQAKIDSGSPLLDIGLDLRRGGKGGVFYRREVALLQSNGLVRRFHSYQIMDGRKVIVWQWVREAGKK